MIAAEIPLHPFAYEVATYALHSSWDEVEQDIVNNEYGQYEHPLNAAIRDAAIACIHANQAEYERWLVAHLTAYAAQRWGTA